MKEIVYFVLGAVIGATLALLFAPASGQEMRANLQAAAEKDTARFQAEWQAAMAKTNERLDQMQAELKQALQRASKQTGDAG
jgi:gas vesicle protein